MYIYSGTKMCVVLIGPTDKREENEKDERVPEGTKRNKKSSASTITSPQTSHMSRAGAHIRN